MRLPCGKVDGKPWHLPECSFSTSLLIFITMSSMPPLLLCLQGQHSLCQPTFW